jgi:hypothetical protein
MIRKNSENEGMTDWDYQHMKELGLKFGKNGKVIVDFDSNYEPRSSFTTGN